MANTHLAHPHLVIDNFAAKIPIRTLSLLSNYLNEKSTLPLETHLEMLVNWRTTLSGRKRRSLFYSEDQPLTGMGLTPLTLLHGRTLEHTSALDF